MDFGGAPKCLACNGTGLDRHVERDCAPCHSKGYMTAEERQAYEHGNIVMQASDRIVPIVQDNEFSRRTLEKVMRRGGDKTQRRIILEHLHGIWPKGLSSSQMEPIYGFLHQSCSSSMTTLHKEGLLSIIGERTNQRGLPEGIYALSGLAYGAWE